MNRFKPCRLVGAVAVAAALATPTTAQAAQSHVVSLQPQAATTCEATIAAVTRDHSITPKSTYTSSLCGFSASLSKRTVEALKLDSRVTAVTPDGYATAA